MVVATVAMIVAVIVLLVGAHGAGSSQC
jgi:hypothetical protein